MVSGFASQQTRRVRPRPDLPLVHDGNVQKNYTTSFQLRKGRLEDLLQVRYNTGLNKPATEFRCTHYFSGMFDKAKNFMMKKLLERQLKNAPAEQRELIMTLVEKNPELFKKISDEMQAEIKSGKTQMAAAMKVMPKYQKEIQAVMGDKMPQRGGGGARFNPNGTLHK